MSVGQCNCQATKLLAEFVLAIEDRLEPNGSCDLAKEFLILPSQWMEDSLSATVNQRESQRNRDSA